MTTLRLLTTGEASFLSDAAGLRVDVDPSARERDGSWATVYDGLHSPGGRLYGLPAVGLRDPGLQIRIRQADGEVYAYVEDLRRRYPGALPGTRDCDGGLRVGAAAVPRGGGHAGRAALNRPLTSTSLCAKRWCAAPFHIV